MTQPLSRILLLCILLMQIVGCRGCNNDSDKAKKDEADANKKKLPLVSDELKALPYAEGAPALMVKPGHWYQARSKLKANYSDESLTASLRVLDRNRKATSFLPGSVPIEFQRNVSLVKGQDKTIELKYFQPEGPLRSDADDANALSTSAKETVSASYSRRGLGTPLLDQDYPTKRLDDYQYNLVLFARDPARYTFWRGLDCIVWPSFARPAEERIAPHRIIDIKEEEIPSHFPNRFYAMTNISHVVINDTSIQAMTTDQQVAFVDWLHFGGTIIVNGPDAIASLDSSFLKPFAPLKTSGTGQLGDAEADRLNRHWTISKPNGETRAFALDAPVPMLQGTLVPDAAWVDNLEGLVAERLIGQGRIVMTTFPMNSMPLVRWPSYSSLVHNAILRKPNRNPSTGLEADTRYAGTYAGSETNPVHSTRLRIWARDLDPQSARNIGSLRRSGIEVPSETQGFQNKKGSFGGWNTTSTVTDRAAACLREASGISVPKIKTVIQLLIGYLIILVPLNWLVFRLMGRPELAWVAAPIIASIGAVVIARGVQLDVGFSRSESTCGFLELHNHHPRGLLTSYRALYTSLSTNYASVYENDAGIVVPVVLSQEGPRRRAVTDKLEYWYADSRGSGLLSMPILSNTTGMLHSEESIEFAGPISARLSDNSDEVTLTSDLGVEVHDVAVIGMTSQGRFSGGWVGELPKGVPKRCNLSDRSEEDLWPQEWDRVDMLAKPTLIREDGTMTTEHPIADGLYLGSMLDELCKTYPLGPGEFIAIGWTDADTSKLKITPVAKQQKTRTVVLFHVTPPRVAEAKPDVSLFWGDSDRVTAEEEAGMSKEAENLKPIQTQDDD